MKQHPVPQNILSVEFKLFGEMTVRQFTYIGGAGLFSWLLYLTPLPGIIVWPIIIIMLLISIAFAFVPINDRPFDEWVTNYIIAIMRPTRRVWKQSKFTPQYLEDQTLIATFQNDRNINLGNDSVPENYIYTNLEDKSVDMLEKTKLRAIEEAKRAIESGEGSIIAQNTASSLAQENLPTKKIPLNSIDNIKINNDMQSNNLNISSTPPATTEIPIESLSNNIVNGKVIEDTNSSSQLTNTTDLPTPTTQKSNSNVYSGSTSQFANNIPEPTVPKPTVPIDKKEETHEVKNEILDLPAPEEILEISPPQTPKVPIFNPQIVEEDIQNESSPVAQKADTIHTSSFTPVINTTTPVTDLTTDNVNTPSDIGATDNANDDNTTPANTAQYNPPISTIPPIPFVSTPIDTLESITNEDIKEPIVEKIEPQININESLDKGDEVKKEGIVKNTNDSTKMDKKDESSSVVDDTVITNPSLPEDKFDLGAKTKADKEREELNKLRKQNEELSHKLTDLQEQMYIQNNITPTDEEQQAMQTTIPPFPDFVQTPNMIYGIVLDKDGKVIPDVVIIIKDSMFKPVRAMRTTTLGQFYTRSPLQDGIYKLELHKEQILFKRITLTLSGEKLDPIIARAITKEEAMTLTQGIPFNSFNSAEMPDEPTKQ